MFRFPTILVLGIMIALGSGCSTRGVRLDEDTTEAQRNKAYAKACAPFAIMSALAYAPPEDCANNKKDQEERALRKEFEEFLTVGPKPWMRRTDLSPTQQAVDAGLHYEIWVNQHYSPTVVAIAVRGTEFTQLQDWKSNLWWLTRFFTDKNQYRIAPEMNEVGRIFAEYKDRPETIFITTGHSLGGGVAQCLRYAFPTNVAQCYAFNPSPVTGFTDQHWGRSSTNEQRIYHELLPVAAFPAHRTLRVYEKGEILAYLRAQTRIIHPLDDKITEVRWNFDKDRNVVRNHGMLSFADKILDVSKDSKLPEPPKAYDPWWAKKEAKDKGAIYSPASK